MNGFPVSNHPKTTFSDIQKHVFCCKLPCICCRNAVFSMLSGYQVKPETLNNYVLNGSLDIFGEITIFHVKIWTHPVVRTIWFQEYTKLTTRIFFLRKTSPGGSVLEELQMSCAPDTRRLKNTASAVDAPSLTPLGRSWAGKKGPLFGQPG